jgi:uncharacterized spore protein YtfJ
MDDRMNEAVAKVNRQIDEMVNRMSPGAVFGEPIQQGDTTLIPVASVTYGFGSGQGWGRGKDEDAPADAPMSEGGGAGGGGGGLARPLGYIKIDATGAKWEPTMDMTRVSVGGMLLAGWIVFWVMKMIRPVVTAKPDCC